MNTTGRIHKIIVLAAIGVAFSVTAYVAYREFIYIYGGLVLTESYSYLIVAVPTVLGVLIKSILDRFTIEGINPYRAASSLVFFLTAILLYILGDALPDTYMEFKTLSAVFLLWSFLAIFLRTEKPLTALLIMLSLIMVVPIPREVISILSSLLTRTTVRVAAYIAGVTVVEEHSGVDLIMEDSEGVDRVYEVTPMLGGATPLLSVLSIAPLLLYLSLTSKAAARMKILYTALSLVSPAALIFTISVLKLALLIVLTRSVGYEEALKVFRQLPPTIYIAIAMLLSVYIVSRLPRKRREYTSVRVKRFWYPSTALLSSIAILVLMTTAFNILAPVASLQALSQSVTYTHRLPESLENTITLSNSTDTFPHIEFRLCTQPNLTSIRGIALTHKNTQILGYIEMADSPTKFYKWHVCVLTQGYSIERSWMEIEGAAINYLILSKSNSKLLLSYAVYGYRLERNTTYVRVSIIASTSEDYSHQVLLARELLDTSVASISRTGLQHILDAVIVLSNASVIVGMALLSLYCIGKLVHSRAASRFKEMS